MFYFQNEYNISNPNFFAIEITDLSVTLSFDTHIIDQSDNKTQVTVRAKSQSLHQVTLNVTLAGDEGYMA